MEMLKEDWVEIDCEFLEEDGVNYLLLTESLCNASEPTYRNKKVIAEARNDWDDDIPF